MTRALQIPEIRQGQALPLQSFLLVGMVRPLRSHPNPTPKRIVGATLAVARLRGLRRFSAQGVAVRLGYIAPSGRKWISNFLPQGDAIGLRYAALSGRKWFADLSAQGVAVGLRYAAPSGRRRFANFRFGNYDFFFQLIN